MACGELRPNPELFFFVVGSIEPLFPENEDCRQIWLFLLRRRGARVTMKFSG